MPWFGSVAGLEYLRENKSHPISGAVTIGGIFCGAPRGRITPAEPHRLADASVALRMRRNSRRRPFAASLPLTVEKPSVVSSHRKLLILDRRLHRGDVKGKGRCEHSTVRKHECPTGGYAKRSAARALPVQSRHVVPKVIQHRIAKYSLSTSRLFTLVMISVGPSGSRFRTRTPSFGRTSSSLLSSTPNNFRSASWLTGTVSLGSP